LTDWSGMALSCRIRAQVVHGLIVRINQLMTYKRVKSIRHRIYEQRSPYDRRINMATSIDDYSLASWFDVEFNASGFRFCMRPAVWNTIATDARHAYMA
jgi:hypothetical protein